jgi:hypothetical protein
MAGSRKSHDAVTHVSLHSLETAIRASWGLDTCDPTDASAWTPENPALGQCAVTALVVNDMFGGDLLEAEVHFPDGTRQGFHYWNRLPRFDLDLTREQFAPGEEIQDPHLIDRHTGGTWLAHDQYLIFRQRVYAVLELETPR